jgi:hypothetical protein
MTLLIEHQPGYNMAPSCSARQTGRVAVLFIALFVHPPVGSL